SAAASEPPAPGPAGPMNVRWGLMFERSSVPSAHSSSQGCMGTEGGSGVANHQRGVIGPARVVARRTIHLRGGRLRGQALGGELVVDPPARIVVEGLAPLRPPGVRPGPVTVEGAVHVHVPGGG